MFYIYYYQNKLNNKIYVGQTNNFKRRHKEQFKKKITYEIEENIKSDIKNGISQEKASIKYNISRRTISRIIKKYNFKCIRATYKKHNLKL